MQPLVQLEHRDRVRGTLELGTRHGAAHGESSIIVGVHDGVHRGVDVLDVVLGRRELLDEREAVGAHLGDGRLRVLALNLLLRLATLLGNLARRVRRLFSVVRRNHLGKDGREGRHGLSSLRPPRRRFPLQPVDRFAPVKTHAALGRERTGAPELHRAAKARDELRQRACDRERVAFHVAADQRLGG